LGAPEPSSIVTPAAAQPCPAEHLRDLRPNGRDPPPLSRSPPAIACCTSPCATVITNLVMTFTEKAGIS